MKRFVNQTLRANIARLCAEGLPPSTPTYSLPDGDQCSKSWEEGSCDASHPPPRAWIKDTLAIRRRVRISTAARRFCSALV